MGKSLGRFLIAKIRPQDEDIPFYTSQNNIPNEPIVQRNRRDQTGDYRPPSRHIRNLSHPGN